jgi:hypothetical protein
VPGVEYANCLTTGFFGRVFAEKFAADRYRRLLTGPWLDALFPAKAASFPYDPDKVPVHTTVTCTSARRTRSSRRRASSSTTGKHSSIGQKRATVVVACSRHNVVERCPSTKFRVRWSWASLVPFSASFENCERHLSPDMYRQNLSREHDVRPRCLGLRRAPFCLRTPQRNRNELAESTVNKTWRKHMPRQEKSIT